jgi:hypothetical protein
MVCFEFILGAKEAGMWPLSTIRRIHGRTTTRISQPVEEPYHGQRQWELWLASPANANISFGQHVEKKAEEVRLEALV